MALSLSCFRHRILQILLLFLKSSNFQHLAIPAIGDVLYKPIALAKLCSQCLTVLRKTSDLLFDVVRPYWMRLLTKIGPLQAFSFFKAVHGNKRDDREDNCTSNSPVSVLPQ